MSAQSDGGPNRRRLSRIKAYRADLRTTYCPPGFWVPAGVHISTGIIAVALLAFVLVMPMTRVWLVKATFVSGAQVQIGIMQFCSKAKAADLLVCRRQLDFSSISTVAFAQDDLDALNEAIIPQLTYTFIFHPLAALMTTLSILLTTIGHYLRFSCFCCFGKGNVPSLAVLTLGCLAVLVAFAFDSALIVYSRVHAGPSIAIDVNVLASAVISGATFFLTISWFALLIYFLRTRHIVPPQFDMHDSLGGYSDNHVQEEDNSSEFFCDREIDASTVISEEPARMSHPPHARRSLVPRASPYLNMYQLPGPSMTTPKAAFMASPRNSYRQTPPSIRIDAGSPIPPNSRPNSNIDARPRPLNASLYIQKAPRENFTAPPVYAASSRYSQSTFFPSSAPTTSSPNKSRERVSPSNSGSSLSQARARIKASGSPASTPSP